MEIKIRKATKDDITSLGKIHYKTWLTTYTGLIPDEFLKTRSEEKSADIFQRKLDELNDNQFIYVAETDNNKVIGFCYGGNSRDEKFPGFGEIYAIYILKDYQGKGIGKLLVKKAINNLKKNSFKEMIIWALEDNKYQNFYIKLGGKKAENKIAQFGDVTVNEVGFIWDDIESINI